MNERRNLPSLDSLWVTLSLFFFLLALLLATLFLLYGREFEERMARELVAREVEHSRRQAREFTRHLEQALKERGFIRGLKLSQEDHRLFEHLSRVLLEEGKVAYLHVLDEKGETLIYRGPSVYRRLDIKNGSISYLEGTTDSIRRVVVDTATAAMDGGELLTIDSPFPMDPAGRCIGHIVLGIRTGKLREGSLRLVRRAGMRLYRYVAAVLVLMALGAALVWYQFKRIWRLERALWEQKRMAYVGTLAGGLAHEIRNPLNGISLNLALVEEGLQELDAGAGEVELEKIRRGISKALSRIRPALSQLESFTNEFLKFARPPVLKVDEVDVNSLLEELVDFFALQCRAQGIEVRLETDPGLESVRSDPARLRNILVNLMVNAIQAMPDGGVLSLRSRREGGRFVLEIEDTGRGMSEDVRRRLFSLFFTTKSNGTGLGLPIVKRLVEDLQGTIEVHSSGEGKGTRFVLSFPLRLEYASGGCSSLEPGAGEGGERV